MFFLGHYTFDLEYFSYSFQIAAHPTRNILITLSGSLYTWLGVLRPLFPDRYILDLGYFHLLFSDHYAFNSGILWLLFSSRCIFDSDYFGYSFRIAIYASNSEYFNYSFWVVIHPIQNTLTILSGSLHVQLEVLPSIPLWVLCDVTPYNLQKSLTSFLDFPYEIISTSLIITYYRNFW